MKNVDARQGGEDPKKKGERTCGPEWNKMLLDFALTYEEYASDAPVLVSLILVGVGGLLSILFWPARRLLSRASFFFAQNAAILLLWAGYVGFNWYGDQVLPTGLWLYASFVADIFILFLMGFIVGAFAVERSFDAFDNRFSAVLTFIPLLNLVLFFTKGDGLDSSYRFRWAANFLGVALGFICLFVSRILEQNIMPEDFDQKIQQAFLDNPEILLQFIATQTNVPERVDEGITLVEVKADGMDLIYSIEVVPNIFDIMDLSPPRPIDPACTLPDLQSVLGVDGNIVQRYISEGRETVELVYTNEICRI